MSKVRNLDNEDVSLVFQVESLLKEREHLKLEYQTLFDSIKKTRFQTQKEIKQLIEHVNQKTYASRDVRAKNQDLLITIFELKEKLKSFEKGKSVNTKFDNPSVSDKFICVTPFNKQSLQKVNFVPKTDEKNVLTKPVTSHTLPKKEKDVFSYTNIITPVMYKVKIKDTQETHKNTNKNVSPSTRVKDASSVKRPKMQTWHITSGIRARLRSWDLRVDNEDTPSSSLIVVEEDEAPQIVSSSEEPIANEPTTPVSIENVNEPVQEDIAAFDGNEFYNPFHSPVSKEAESSSTFQDPSNMHEFYQPHRSTDK
ncbi:hypothetical protein Tco_0221239 [Tanacetum coccineum]